MVQKTFTNVINESEVSLAIERLFISEFPQAYSPARIDVDSPPTGFFDLGAVVEDSPTFTTERTKFELDAGIPAVRQFEAITGLSGTFEITLHSFSWRKLQFALGNYSAVSSFTEITTIASVTDKNTVTFANTSDVESLVVGLQFAFAAAAANLDDPDTPESKVASITNDGLTFFIVPTPVKTPVAGDVVAYYDKVEQFFGTSQIRQHVLVGVADFLNGQQIQHHFFKVTPAGEFTEAINPTENARTSLQFTAFGVSRSDVPGASSEELAIARRIQIPAGIA